MPAQSLHRRTESIDSMMLNVVGGHSCS